MKKVIPVIILIFTMSFLFAEDKTETKKEKKKSETITKSPDGYNKVTWGTLLSKAKDNLKGNITYTDDKSVIITKGEGIEYNYGFFYIDPLKIGIKAKEKKKTDGTGAIKPADKKKEEKTDEGKFFYLAIKFPYISIDEIKKKLQTQYGDPTTENIKNNKGVATWDSEKTIIIMWVDEYEKKAFSRRITYISKDIAIELNNYQNDVFNKKENLILKNLLP